MENRRLRFARSGSAEAGFTLLEVMTAIAVMVIAIFPLIDSIKHSRSSVRLAEVRRTMKQLLDYKMSQVLLDQPPEDQEPIYVDGAEGNFGSEFDNDKSKSYWHDDKYYNYSFRIDSEEVDLSESGGEETEEEAKKREEDEKKARSSDGAGGLFGGGAGGEDEESKSQMRYRVTLTIFFRTGNPRFDQSMSAVTYVKHPREKEQMSGPQPEGGANGLGTGPGGLGNMQAGGGKAVNGAPTMGGSSGSVIFQAGGKGVPAAGGRKR